MIVLFPASASNKPRRIPAIANVYTTDASVAKCVGVVLTAKRSTFPHASENGTLPVMIVLT